MARGTEGRIAPRFVRNRLANAGWAALWLVPAAYAVALVLWWGLALAGAYETVYSDQTLIIGTTAGALLGPPLVIVTMRAWNRGVGLHAQGMVIVWIFGTTRLPWTEIERVEVDRVEDDEGLHRHAVKLVDRHGSSTSLPLASLSVTKSERWAQQINESRPHTARKVRARAFASSAVRSTDRDRHA